MRYNSFNEEILLRAEHDKFEDLHRWFYEESPFQETYPKSIQFWFEANIWRKARQWLEE